MIDAEKSRRVIEKYSTPFYVFDEDAFQENYFHLCEAFKKEYEQYQIAYSFKTNYTPYICELVKQNGGYAEVVSDMELNLAYRLGFQANEIIFNGPFKGNELETHLVMGGIANLDCEEEVDRLINYSKTCKKQLKVGLRLNFDIGANYISRFGFDIQGDSLIRAIHKIRETENVRIVGIHCHISRARDLESWNKRILTLLEMSSKYFDDDLEYIDVGSGMFGDMDESMRDQFDIHIPSYEEYALVVDGAMRRHFLNKKIRPMLISEPGTTVVSKYLSLFTSVVQIKTNQGVMFATVDSSYQNAGEACKMKKLPYRAYNCEQNTNRQIVNIMGYTCLEQDCLYHNMQENIKVGTVLEFGNVGGYSLVYKPPFIRPNCMMIAISDKHDDIEIKERESFDDIFKTFRFKETE